MILFPPYIKKIPMFRKGTSTSAAVTPSVRARLSAKYSPGMAAFVHPRTGGKVIPASGYETRSYKPPMVNPADITTADMLMERQPGESMYSGKTPAQRAAERIVADYQRLNDAVTRREEWAQGGLPHDDGVHIGKSLGQHLVCPVLQVVQDFCGCLTPLGGPGQFDLITESEIHRLVDTFTNYGDGAVYDGLDIR